MLDLKGKEKVATNTGDARNNVAPCIYVVALGTIRTSGASDKSVPPVFCYVWRTEVWYTTSTSMHPVCVHSELALAYGFKRCTTDNGLLVAHCFLVRHG